MRVCVRVKQGNTITNIINLIFKMSMKTIENVRECYEIPACEELDVRIEQSILSKQPGDPNIDGDEDLGNI